MSTPTHSLQPPRAAAGPSLPRAVVALVLLFLAALALGRFGVDGLTSAAVTAFKAVAGAHYQLYLARENINESGEAEFAVLLGDGQEAALEAYISDRVGWSQRESLVPGWRVIMVPPDNPGALAALRDAGFARAVLRNRGLWICH
jgi:hypothetical protein